MQGQRTLTQRGQLSNTLSHRSPLQPHFPGAHWLSIATCRPTSPLLLKSRTAPNNKLVSHLSSSSFVFAFSNRGWILRPSHLPIFFGFLFQDLHVYGFIRPFQPMTFFFKKHKGRISDKTFSIIQSKALTKSGKKIEAKKLYYHNFFIKCFYTVLKYLNFVNNLKTIEWTIDKKEFEWRTNSRRVDGLNNVNHFERAALRENSTNEGGTRWR